MKRIGALRAAVLRSVVCVVAAVGVVSLGPGAAQAAPATPATPSPSSVEQQIDAQWNQLEPVIEDFNGAQIKLQNLTKQENSLKSTLQPLEAKVTVALVQVQGLAVDAYMQGTPSALDAMLISGSPTGLVDKLTLLDQLALHQQSEISGVVALRDKYAKQEQQLNQVTQAAAARYAQLSQQKTAIQAKIDSLQKLRTAAGAADTEDDGPLRTGLCPVTYTDDKGGRAAQKACSLIGKPYIFGADGPNAYDCSGLTKEAWASVGVFLDHYTKDQWAETAPVTRAELRPGDLVFYYPPTLHHVAIYIGGGMVVHAPHTGDFVRMATIDRGPIAGYRRPG